MSFAVSRMALIAALSAAVLLSAGGLTRPGSIAAAEPQSVLSIQSASLVQSVSSAQSASAARSVSIAQTISQRAKIVQITESHLGANYRFGAEGMTSFDCSGLVWRVYKQAGLEAKIGSARKGARAYYHWFKRRGLASRSDPKPGDLVIWHKGTHIGIYIGNGEIISALNKKYGVRKHGLNFVSGFTAYLHVQIKGRVPQSGGGTSGGDTGGGNTGGMPTSVKVTDNYVTVRDGVGMGHDRVAVLDHGTTVHVTDAGRDASGRKWFKVTLANGKTGWIPAWHVTAA